MNIKEKALTEAATSERAKDDISVDTIISSKMDITTEADIPQEGLITCLLHRGQENAITTSEIMSVLRCDIRTVRELVESERKHGALILASSAGYFLPDEGQKGIDEMKRSYRLSRAKAIGHLRSISPVYHKLKELGALERELAGQEKIEDL